MHSFKIWERWLIELINNRLHFILGAHLITHYYNTFMQGSSRNNEKKMEHVYISVVDFEKYLETLPPKQRAELRQFLESHPLVQSRNRGPQKCYRGSPAILKEIQYLIAQSKQKREENISESFMESVDQSIDIKLFTERIPNLSFSQPNFNEITNRIATLKKIDSCPFELVARKKNELSSQGDIYITNRCRGIKKIFFIFQQFHELIQLQALIDMEWKLETISTIKQKFEEEGIKMLKNLYSTYELFFFQRVGPESWDKFILNINKQIPVSYFILMKFSLFPELMANKKKFTSPIRLAFPEEDIFLPDFTITQLKVFTPDMEFIPVHDLAVSVLRNNEREYSWEGELLDCITSFNFFIMQDRGEKEMLVVLPDETNNKQYVYFTFYKKIMEILREGDKFVLVERSVKDEISNSIYRNSLEDIIKQAVIRNCPFFYFCQNAKEVTKVPIDQCKKAKSQDINRLLYYRYKLKQKCYNASAANTMDIEEIVTRIQRPFLFKFQSDKIILKMGKTKSEEIMKKYREGSNGCILGRASFCRSFIQKCFELVEVK